MPRSAGRETYESAVASLGAFYRRWPVEVAALISGHHPLQDAPGLLVGRTGAITDVLSLDAAS